MNSHPKWPLSSCCHPEACTVTVHLLVRGGGHLIHWEEETGVEQLRDSQHSQSAPLEEEPMFG